MSVCLDCLFDEALPGEDLCEHCLMQSFRAEAAEEAELTKRSYTVLDLDETRHYKGFDKSFDERLRRVAVYLHEGELNVVAMDENDPGAHDELQRYLGNIDAGDSVVYLGTFTRG